VAQAAKELVRKEAERRQAEMRRAEVPPSEMIEASREAPRRVPRPTFAQQKAARDRGQAARQREEAQRKEEEDARRREEEAKKERQQKVQAVVEAAAEVAENFKPRDTELQEQSLCEDCKAMQAELERLLEYRALSPRTLKGCDAQTHTISSPPKCTLQLEDQPGQEEDDPVLRESSESACWELPGVSAHVAVPADEVEIEKEDGQPSGLMASQSLICVEESDAVALQPDTEAKLTSSDSDCPEPELEISADAGEEEDGEDYEDDEEDDEEDEEEDEEEDIEEDDDEADEEADEETLRALTSSSHAQSRQAASASLQPATQERLAPATKSIPTKSTAWTGQDSDSSDERPVKPRAGRRIGEEDLAKRLEEICGELDSVF